MVSSHSSRRSYVTNVLAKRILILIAMTCAPAALQAQMVEDGFMMGRGNFCTGFMLSSDRWDQYWEGTLKRSNGNIGTLSTANLAWFGNYGVTKRLNAIAMLPYVWTSASAGTQRGLHGLQDATLALKLDVLETAFTNRGSLSAIVVAAVGAPVTHYSPDLLPFSIGLGSRNASGRFTLKFQTHEGWFLHGTAAYTRRSNVTLDRPSYFTNGQLYLSDQVAMPDVLDYAFSVGYTRKGLQVPISFSQQRTQGGGDIRRQDMPFLSDRMNQSRIGAQVLWALPPAKDLSLLASAAYTLDGRNVGQSTTFTVGLLYLFHF